MVAGRTGNVFKHITLGFFIRLVAAVLKRTKAIQTEHRASKFFMGV